MSIDPMILNPMLDAFRNMLKEVQEKELTGPDVDMMTETMARMEALGQEHSDINVFNGALMQENLFGKFSEFYSKALAAEAKGASDEKAYDDSTLLKQSIDALKNAILEIKKRYEEAIEEGKNKDAEKRMNEGLDYVKRATGMGGAKLKRETKKEFDKNLEDKPAANDSSVETAILNDPELIIKGIQDVIDLGEQDGMTLPRFLRLQTEKGLDKAMEGMIVQRNGQEFILNLTISNPLTPFHITKETQKIEKFDELAAKHKFNLPNSKELSYANREIEREHERDIEVWRDIVNRWDDLLWQLSFWSTSYCSYAPHIDPWAMAANPRESCIRTQKTVPGIFKQKERLLQKYHGLSFHDIFKHPTFEWAVKYSYYSDSQEWLMFAIEKLYPQCKPFNDLSSELIAERASFSKYGPDKVDRQMNPDLMMPSKRTMAFYDSKFGEGRYLSRFGEILEIDTSSRPWDFDTFKYK